MTKGYVSRGFVGRRQQTDLSGRIPPGQHLTTGFPVLSAGPTPLTPLAKWSFTILKDNEKQLLKSWTWEQFQVLPSQPVTADIHCVTRWSKLDTRWEGVAVDTLLAGINHNAGYVVAFCDGGYTTNLPLADVTGGKAWVVYTYDGSPLEPEHGGPARLLVPHLYLWKSAKWVRGLLLVANDRPGFWESNGYNMYGDVWKEQRYAGD